MILLLLLLPLLVSGQSLAGVSTESLLQELSRRGVGGQESSRSGAGRQEVEDKCQELLEKFSQSSSNFTRWCRGQGRRQEQGKEPLVKEIKMLIRCANQYAKPIFMCRQCLEHYLDVRKYYQALEHRWNDQ